MNLRAVDNYIWRDGLDADATFCNAVGKLVEVWVNMVGRTAQAQMHLIKMHVDITIQQEGVNRDHEPICRAEDIHLVLFRVAGDHEGEEDHCSQEAEEFHSCSRLGHHSQEARRRPKRNSRTHQNTRGELPYGLCKVQG